MSRKSLSLISAVSLLAILTVSACGPTPVDPQVKGSHSTVSGDSGATREFQTR